MTTYLVAAVIFGGLTSLAVSHVVKSELRDKLTNVAMEIASRLAADSTLALALKSVARAQDAAVAALSLTHVRYVAIYRADHQTFYEHGSPANDVHVIDRPGGDVMRISIETPSAMYVDAPVVLISDVDGVTKRELLGHVRLGMSKQGYIDIEHQLQRGVWVIKSVLGVLIIMILWADSKRVTAPLIKLDGTIERGEKTGELSPATLEGTADVRGIASAYNSLRRGGRRGRRAGAARGGGRARGRRRAGGRAGRRGGGGRRRSQGM